MNKTDFSQLAKQLGAKGGNTTLERYGKDHFSKIGKMKRKKKKEKQAVDL